MDDFARARARYLVAMGMGALGAAGGFAACGGGGVVAAPMGSAETDGGSDSGEAGPTDAAGDRRTATRPLPPEPGPSARQTCRRDVTCNDPDDEPQALPYPSPFERCAPTSGKGRSAQFSVQETRGARSSSPDVCCYVELKDCRSSVGPVKGRPPRDGSGALVLAEVEPRGDWRAPLATGPAPPAVAAHWLEVARMEHASVAAFASLSLDLLALGAPADLIAGAHAAALDEIEHARLAFALVSSYSGRDIGPGPLPNAPRSLDASRTLLETLRDGCVGEALAALEARAAAARASDPAARAALERIADDEERHAELAFRILAWLARSRPELARALEDVRVAPGPRRADDDRGHEAFGVLGGAALDEVRTRAIREVLEPCLEAAARLAA